MKTHSGSDVSESSDEGHIGMDRQFVFFRRAAVAGLPILFGLLVAFFVMRVGTTGHGAGLVEAYDFRALYCGGVTTLAHADPYRTEPLRSCEHDRSPSKLFVADVPKWVVLPAPYPGYALEMFSGLARFDFPIAKAIWLGILAASLGYLAFALAALSGWPILVVGLTLLPTVVLYNIWLGSTPPLAMLGVALAALAVARKRPALAVPPLAVAMIDPHLVLPAAIALVLIAPKARVAALAGLAVLVALSVHAIGIGGNLEYFQEALPMHARAEVFVRLQYSLTHVLALLGVPIDLALKAGTLSYVALAIAAVFYATREADSAQGGARAIVLPCAIVALGGTFIHNQEISLALPAAFVLARSLRSDTQRLLLTVGFMGILFSPIVENLRLVAPSYIVASAAVAFVLWPRRRFAASAISAVAAVALIVILRALPATHFTDTAATLPEPPGITGATSSGVVWADFLAGRPSWTHEDAVSIALKIPTWLGLISIIILGATTRVVVANNVEARKLDESPSTVAATLLKA